MKASVFSWEKLDEAVKVEGSDKLNIIPNNYDTLDNEEGPFDVFSLYETHASSDGGLEGLVNTVPWTVDSDDLSNTEKAKVTATFNYTATDSAQVLDDKAVYVTVYDDSGSYSTRYFVFSKDSTDNYNSSSLTKIDVSSSSLTVAGAISSLASQISSVFSSYVEASSSGTTLTMTSKMSTAWSNSNTIRGGSLSGSSTSGTNRTAAGNTGASFGTFSGGTNSSGMGDADSPLVAGTPATATVTGLSSAAADTGFTMYINGYGTTYIRMTDTSDGIAWNSTYGTYTMGKNASFSNRSIGGATLSYSNGTLSVTTNSANASANYSSFTDGITGQTSTTSTYTPATPASLSSTSTSATITPAAYTLDVSSYQGNTSTEDLEAFIQSLAGITNNYFTLANNRYSSDYRRYFEFIDTGGTEAVAALTKVPYGQTSTKIDLNNMRSRVDSGEDIATAFAETVNAVAHTSYVSSSVAKDSTNNTIGVTFSSNYYNSASALFKDYDATLGHYEVDFSSVNTSNLVYLDDTGFRIYCATDEEQWYNFLLDDGKEDLPDRPASGTATLDINTAVIDISQVTDSASLVQAVYRDGDAVMADIDHYYRLSLKASDDTKLYIYDPRRFNISLPQYYGDKYNEQGAKIADGVYDNVIKSRRDIMQKQIIIQDTDKADFNTRLYIDQTTLDHLFEYKIGNDDIFNYSVTSAADREKLLGNEETGDNGMLDNAIQKLLEAQTLLGAQASRLEATGVNLTVTAENEQASESVIRDADMAKATVEFARFNILTQSSQAMLGQANQSSSSVLSLLQ